MINERRLLIHDITEMRNQVFILKSRLKDIKLVKKRQSNQVKVDAKEDQLKLDVKHLRMQLNVYLNRLRVTGTRKTYE